MAQDIVSANAERTVEAAATGAKAAREVLESSSLYINQERYVNNIFSYYENGNPSLDEVERDLVQEAKRLEENESITEEDLSMLGVAEEHYDRLLSLIDQTRTAETDLGYIGTK